MDRGYFLTGFGIAAAVAFSVALVLVARVDAWRLLRQTDDDPRARLYLLAAVVVLLWVATFLTAQIVSAASVAASQAFVFSGDVFESGARLRWLSLSSGISTGVQAGFALGLIGYVLRAVMEIRSVVVDDSDWESADGGGDVDWSRPSEE
jgi:Trk-type K+ transport system membrane component